MTGYRGVLIYDGECPFCSAAASALRRIPNVGAVPWGDEAAQTFLAAQFEETPFALVFIDADESRVYVGREAGRELCNRAGVPVLVQDIVGDNYEGAADAIRTVSGLDREPDPYHGSYPLADEARERFQPLAARADKTTKVTK